GRSEVEDPKEGCQLANFVVGEGSRERLARGRAKPCIEVGALPHGHVLDVDQAQRVEMGDDRVLQPDDRPRVRIGSCPGHVVERRRSEQKAVRGVMRHVEASLVDTESVLAEPRLRERDGMETEVREVRAAMTRRALAATVEQEAAGKLATVYRSAVEHEALEACPTDPELVTDKAGECIGDLEKADVIAVDAIGGCKARADAGIGRE